jgi:hypothetical protein
MLLFSAVKKKIEEDGESILYIDVLGISLAHGFARRCRRYVVCSKQVLLRGDARNEQNTHRVAQYLLADSSKA